MPTVSVIVPNYNHAPFLKQRIDSILGQTYQDFELILLDDNSSDGSRDVMENYRSDPHVSHIVYNEANSGSAFRQWNKGITLAKGEWIWVAESDDYAEPTFLGRLMDEVAKEPDSTMAYAATWWVDMQGNNLWNNSNGNAIHIHDGHDYIRHRLAVANSIANVSECIFRRNCYHPTEASRYEHMRLCGDWFFYILLAEQGNVIELEEPLNYYRQHSSNISNDAEHRGLTLIEGANVLEYIIKHCGVKNKDYARGWGKLWACYERKYNFTSDVKQQVRKRMLSFPAIIFWHTLYTLKRWPK